jgi:hypothetical protein
LIYQNDKIMSIQNRFKAQILKAGLILAIILVSELQSRSTAVQSLTTNFVMFLTNFCN